MMSRLLFILALFLCYDTLSAFLAIPGNKLSLIKLHAKVPMEVVGRNLEVTEPLREKINAKIGGVLDKLGSLATSSHVSIRVDKSAKKSLSDIAEVTIYMKGGAVIRATEGTDDMYASIDIVSLKVAQKLKQHKQKINSKDGKTKTAKIEELAIVVEDEAPIVEDDVLMAKYKETLGEKPEQWAENFSTVVKSKSFPMPAISVEEALLYLDLIDHPFYVFRNKDTNEINVVYKRAGGNAGLIQPE